MADLTEYRAGLGRRLSGEWDEEGWTAYRVRFGVYGQRQPGVQMVRIKVPGGILDPAALRVIARVNRDFAQGDAHITTRQDIQIYSVPLERTADLLAELYGAGITTREACGNTLRNMTACALAGVCPRERTDAGAVAAQLARSWIRQPLVQHMPRKVKISVSGCETDCGASSIHDLGLVATERDGRAGFRVLVGGGLGGAPRVAVPVLDFVEEEDLPVVVEALARLHQRYSDRRNRNASRLKFLVKRFGEDKFRALFAEEFARLRGLPQRPWQRLAWRAPEAATVARTPVGVVPQHDGRTAIVASPPLGLLSSDQLDGLAALAEAAGVTQLRTTRDQNIALLGVGPGEVGNALVRLAALGLGVSAGADEAVDVISCPGTTTCRIGITNSQNFARQLLAEAESDAQAAGVSVRVSGCQNSCGLHHVGDFGFHGVAKKIDGRHAPHYQIHLGGSAFAPGALGLAGPIVPARLAGKALKLLRDAYARDRAADEPVRAWAERLGKEGIAAVLAPLDSADAGGVFVDWGEAGDFAGPPQARGECAAPFASDSLFADLADDALIGMDRALFIERTDEARGHAADAVLLATRRLLLARGALADGEQPAAVVEAQLKAVAAGEPDLLAAFDAARAAGPVEALREAVALWLDSVRAAVEAPAAPAFDPAQLFVGEAAQ